MEDGELEKVALDFPALAEVAKSVLHSEMSRRHLTPPAEIAANYANEIAESEARRPVMIRRYRDLPEASIAKSVLESAGVECVLADDNLVRLDWFYSNLVGGIKLLVPEKDGEAAIQLLDESPPEKFDVEGVGEYHRTALSEVRFDGYFLGRTEQASGFWRDVHYKRANSRDRCRLEMPFVWAAMERRRRF